MALYHNPNFLSTAGLVLAEYTITPADRADASGSRLTADINPASNEGSYSRFV